MAVIAGRGAPLPKDEAGLQLVTAPFNPKDVDRREMISAGAAAGIAAAFGALRSSTGPHSYPPAAAAGAVCLGSSLHRTSCSGSCGG